MSTQSVSIPEMINQSREIITNPSVASFERYERHGNLTNAAIYIGIAAVIAGLLGLTGGFGGLLRGIIGTLISFFVFTGMVYFIGKTVSGGTGTWDEVAYTFSLFIAPLNVIAAVIGFVVWLLLFIPILGILAGLAAVVIGLGLLVVQAYFAYLGVQSSMNIIDPGKAAVALILAVIGTWIVNLVVLGALAFV